MLNCSVMSDSLQPHGLWLPRLLCPWNFPGKSTGVSCHFLLQRIFPTQEFSPRLLHHLHWQADSSLELPGKPLPSSTYYKCTFLYYCSLNLSVLTFSWGTFFPPLFSPHTFFPPIPYLQSPIIHFLGSRAWWFGRASHPVLRTRVWGCVCVLL